MAKGSHKKRQKVDKISSLPDELLCHILSFLQTKEVVATSVLSSRWKSVWTLVLVLHFEDNWTCFSQTSLANVVSKVLDQHKAKTIKRLCLSSKTQQEATHCSPELISTLFSFVMERNLEGLDITFFSRLEASLSITLFTCQTISILKLSGTISLSIPSSVHFPLLKILDLNALYFENDEHITRFFFGCPILEELFFYEVNIDRICVPSLKKLTVRSKLERLHIDTPLLEYLQVQNTIVLNYSVENMHNLIDAIIDIYFDPDEEKEYIPNLFNGTSRTKYLSLSTTTTEVVTYAALEFPKFHNLVHLQLSLITLDSYFLVEQMLESSPKLEVLDIEKVDGESEIEWTQPTIVPSCLSSHLTVFTFRQYGGSRQELKLVEYILKNAKALKTNTIQIASELKQKPKRLRRAMAKIWLLPKASEDCRTHYESLP